MIADTRYAELERRVRTVEEEMNGEKHLTRYAVEQTLRNGDALNALRAEIATLRAEVIGLKADVNAFTLRIDHVGADVAAIKAALVMHGRALDVLQQDVRQLRSEMAEVRGDITAVRAEMAEFRGDITAIRGEMATRLDIDAIRGEMATRHNELLAAIRALGGGVSPAA
jgi:chromosome segregation ATPase